jgi:hypothetical protein
LHGVICSLAPLSPSLIKKNWIIVKLGNNRTGLVFPLVILPILCALIILIRDFGLSIFKTYSQKTNTFSAHLSFDRLELGFGSSSLRDSKKEWVVPHRATFKVQNRFSYGLTVRFQLSIFSRK